MFVMNMFNQPKSPHSTHGTNIHFKLVSYIIKQMIIVLLYYNNTREIPTSLESYCNHNHHDWVSAALGFKTS